MSALFYEGDIWSKSAFTLRNPKFCQELAQFLCSLELSGDQTMDWMLAQIYFRHKGNLYDYTGTLIDLKTTYVDQMFGEEPRRWINAFKEYATVPPKQRLQWRCVPRVMFMDFARTIHLGGMETPID